MFDEIIKLVAESKTTNQYGDQVVVRSERQVFADLRSICQSEFYQAQAVGLKPEIKFVLADYLDYKNEKVLLYKPFDSNAFDEYRVLRTYRTGTNLELVCVRGVEHAGT